MISPHPILATTDLGLVGAPADVTASVASAMESIRGCVTIAIPSASEAQNELLSNRELGLLVVFVGDDATKPAVQELVRLSKNSKPAVPVIVLAEPRFAADAADFLRWGVADCLLRPLNLSRLSFLIDFLTLRRRTCGSRTREVVRKLAAPADAQKGGLIFESQAAQRLHATAARLASVETNVLLQGETGSGKTCVARLIHELSPRRNKPFVVVNCGSLPETLLEGELFGYRQGAFTGADRCHRGKFAQAEDGTLFLDEIDSLPLPAQSSLLRVIEERAFEALGSDRTERLRARLIFATNRELMREVEAGRFRQDLYYRLNVVSLAVPSLRTRQQEIPTLVATYLAELRQKKVTLVRQFSGDALERMSQHAWPGNLRELRNVVERVAVLCDHEVATIADLPPEIAGRPIEGFHLDPPAHSAVESPASDDGKTSQLVGARRTAERQTIVRTLQQCAQNRSRTAQSLGISRAALYKKLRQFGIA